MRLGTVAAAGYAVNKLSAIVATVASHGALLRWSRQDPVEGTRTARLAWESSFERRVRAEAAERGELLSNLETARRAESLRKAHYVKLAIRTAEVTTAKRRRIRERHPPPAGGHCDGSHRRRASSSSCSLAICVGKSVEKFVRNQPNDVPTAKFDRRDYALDPLNRFGCGSLEHAAP